MRFPSEEVRKIMEIFNKHGIYPKEWSGSCFTVRMELSFKCRDLSEKEKKEIRKEISRLQYWCNVSPIKIENGKCYLSFKIRP